MEPEDRPLMMRCMPSYQTITAKLNDIQYLRFKRTNNNFFKDKI